MGSTENSEPTYSSISSLNTDEGDNKPNQFRDDGKPITVDDDGNLLYEINVNAENYRLHKTTAAHYAGLGKKDAYLATKTLCATEAQYLNTKALNAKLDEVAKTVDFDVSTILAKKITDPFNGTVRSWLRKRTYPVEKSPKFQQFKGLFRYCQEFDRLFFEEEGQFLCNNEPSDRLDVKNQQICLPLLFNKYAF